MDLRRLRVGEWLMAAVGAALLAALAVDGSFGVAHVLLALLPPWQRWAPCRW